MKKLWLLLLLACGPAFGQVIGPPNQVQCNQFVGFATGSTGPTRLLSGVLGKNIFICGWHITNTGSSGTWALVSGTGTNCGSTTTTLIQPQSITSNAPASDHIDFAQLAITTTSTAIDMCVSPSVNTIAGGFWIGQY